MGSPCDAASAAIRSRRKKKNPSLATIERQLPHYFEFGTVYTMIAGLLNILAVYDACCGPVIAVDKEEEPAEEQGRGETKK